MLRAIPRKALLWSFTLWDGDRQIGETDFGWFQGISQLSPGDAVYEVDPGSYGSGPYRLMKGDEVICLSGGFG